MSRPSDRPAAGAAPIRAMSRGGGAASAPGDQSLSRARPAASAPAQHCRRDLRGEPASRRPRRKPGTTGSRWTSVLPAAAVSAASVSRCGQGASGLTWSGVTGDTPPQSLMPAAMKRGSAPPARLGGAWMLIAGPKTSRATAIVQRWSSRSGSGAAAIRVPGLARKFWTMISWIWPWRSWSARSASIASIRSARVSPMPMRRPEVNGTAASPARSMVARRGGGVLVGRAEMRAAAGREARGGGLQHDPHRRRHRAERGEIVGAHQPRIEVGQEAGPREHEPGDFAEVGQRRRVAERRELVAGDTVAALGLVAEGEERLGASRRPPGLGDGEDILGRQVGALAPPRRMGEGAVVADVAAELGQRDEDLPRIGHDRAEALVAEFGRDRPSAGRDRRSRRATAPPGRRAAGRRRLGRSAGRLTAPPPSPPASR